MITCFKILLYASTEYPLSPMKKQELIHLHGLLSEVHTQCEKWEGKLNLTDYKSLGVEPTSIHKSKNHHKDAVFKLAKSITSEVNVKNEESRESVASKAK